MTLNFGQSSNVVLLLRLKKIKVLSIFCPPSSLVRTIQLPEFTYFHKHINISKLRNQKSESISSRVACAILVQNIYAYTV